MVDRGRLSGAMSRRRRAVIAALALAAAAPIVAAQGPRGADTLSGTAVAESLKVVAAMRARVKADPSDAASWHRLGMVAWALLDRAHAANPPRGIDAVQIGGAADSGLRMAAEHAPQNAMFRLSIGQFLLASPYAWVRTGANSQFEKALDAARKSGDSTAIGEAAVEFGRAAWRQYDAFENRRMITNGADIGRSLLDLMQPVSKAAATLAEQSECPECFDLLPDHSMKMVRDAIEQLTQRLPSDVAGGADYARAEALFREAYAAAPANPRTFRSLAMLLADSSRWQELQTFARDHLRRIPWDPMGWMTTGLAEQRLGRAKAAAAAFDSAMAYIAPEERARLDRFDRVLRPADTARINRAPANERTARLRAYWLFADPLWSRDGNEARVEYFARVTFAELRWTVDELGVRGADTDRGDIYIRYGPPDLMASIGPGVNADMDGVVTFWLYHSGLYFSFKGQPTYGTARTPIDDIKIVEAETNAQPVRWDNLSTVTVDTMPVQVARFRASPDSLDVLIAAAPVYATIAASAQVKEPIRTHLWLLSDVMASAFADSGTLESQTTQTWSHRLKTGGYVYRIEAGAPSADHAGRAAAPILVGDDPRSGFAMRGFGISDVLLATSTNQPSGTTRWNALKPVPLAGVIPHGGQINVVWENYEFGAASGVAEYAVTITITRDRSPAGRIAATVLGALASVARIETQSDRVSVHLDRTMPYAPAFADAIEIGLGDTPAGTYILNVEVTDKATSRKATRTLNFAIRK